MNPLNYLNLNCKINTMYNTVSESNYLKDNACFPTGTPQVSTVPLN